MTLFSRYRTIQSSKIPFNTNVEIRCCFIRCDTKGIFRASLALVQNDLELRVVKQVPERTCC